MDERETREIEERILFLIVSSIIFVDFFVFFFSLVVYFGLQSETPDLKPRSHPLFVYFFLFVSPPH